MISIIKIITDAHKPFQFVQLTKTKRIEMICSAKKRIIVLCPWISKDEAISLVKMSKESEIRLYFDCNRLNLSRSEDYLDAVKVLVDSKILPSEIRWEIGVFIVDNKGWIYFPEKNDSDENQISAIELDLGEVETLIKSTFVIKEEVANTATSREEFNEKKMEVEKVISKAQVKIDGVSLFEKLDKLIQFVEIEIKGLVKVQNKRISLKSKKFEFLDKKFDQRFKAGYLIFDHSENDMLWKKIDADICVIREKVNKIKQCFMVSTCEGLVMKCSDAESFQKAISEIDKEIKSLKDGIAPDLGKILESSKAGLRKFIEKLYSIDAIRLKVQPIRLEELSKEELRDQAVNMILDEIKFPSSSNLLDDILIEYSFKGLTSQVCLKEKFMMDIEEKFGLIWKAKERIPPPLN